MHITPPTNRLEDFSLRFVCPMCGAAVGEKCISHRRTPRCESHDERRDLAADHRPNPPANKVQPTPAPNSTPTKTQIPMGQLASCP